MANIKEYPWISLSTIARYEPEMKKLGVSEKARGVGGFLWYYKKIGGNSKKVSDHWRNKRYAFISRMLPVWKQSKGRRAYLSLIAWAYLPK